jgi:formylglycine-generating enzyme required for sulfatase activity
VAGLAADDWWTETFVQLAGLVDDADRLAQEVAQANPWLGWWCVNEGREVEEATCIWVEDRSARLLRSDHVADRRRAVQTLARMQSERTIEPLFQAAADPDAEIVGLAVGALVGLGEPARTWVIAALYETDPRRRLPALRYLERQPDESLCRGITWEQLLGQPLVWVPPGPFLMGSDRAKDTEAWEDELPQHQVTLSGYWIGRHPVTVAHFREFITQSGHKLVDADSLEGQEDHPVVRITWHEALAYCRWLGGIVGLPVTLPTEAEWEKAARGIDGRIYPWGDEFDATRCNSIEAREADFYGTTPVGRYSPQGDSPYGCADMAGNVWEWCRSLYRPYPCQAGDGREALETKGNRVVRGGAFYDSERFVRCASRSNFYRFDWNNNIGFRVVVAPGPSDL